MSRHDEMLAAIDAAQATPLASADLAAAVRIAQNLKPEQQAAEIRIRAERRLAILLREAAGLAPKNKRDAAFLAEFAGPKP